MAHVLKNITRLRNGVQQVGAFFSLLDVPVPLRGFTWLP